ncbi:MAG: hypothetical protein WDO19_23285 [Bacteroidota bacterium]
MNRINCTPGAHFAYAYVALRNDCAGLEISGNPVACANTSSIYSIPALANASYSWTVPPGWTINSGANSNILNVTPAGAGGIITAREVNGCGPCGIQLLLVQYRRQWQAGLSATILSAPGPTALC